MIKAILIKPLDGFPAGTERDFSQVDFDRLKTLNAVRRAPEKKAAPQPQNKMAPAPANKAEGAAPKNKLLSADDIRDVSIGFRQPSAKQGK
ncbi:MAG: hypothetical protein H0W39_01065 [Sphingomonas sp.]|nr:hypothetical protein [Sphingomonas sp.]